MQVLLPAEFQEEHRRIVLEFARRGHEFDRVEWQKAIAAFDLLKNAAVLTGHGLLPFPVIYRQQIEDSYADEFIEALYQVDYVANESIRRWAAVARTIGPRLAQAGLFRSDVPAIRLIVAYCLYWWRAFTLGYTLEIEVQRDLEASGIRFQAHDLRRREERLSPYDLQVLGFKGDIKTSVYFLQAARTRTLPHDFYITRVRGQQRTRTLVGLDKASPDQGASTGARLPTNSSFGEERKGNLAALRRICCHLRLLLAILEVSHRVISAGKRRQAPADDEPGQRGAGHPQSAVWGDGFRLGLVTAQ